MPDDREQESPDQQPAPSAEEQPSGRDRLRRALLRPSRSQVVVAVLLALVGYAAITQVRFNEVDNTYGSLREQDLIDVLNGLAGTTQRAESEIARLQRTRDDLQSSTGAREAALVKAQEDADTLAIMAGLVPVTGPGIRVTITEGDTAIDADTMVDMIQELRTAGAEAIQINGKARVVARTSFADAVGGIMVGDQLVSSPYVVDAIGDPHAMSVSGIDFPDGPREQFEAADATVEVDELASLDIESVVQPERPEYAVPESSQ
jgi:uncharacterized protein YlxW (UPF0749 family)